MLSSYKHFSLHGTTNNPHMLITYFKLMLILWIFLSVYHLKHLNILYKEHKI